MRKSSKTASPEGVSRRTTRVSRLSLQLGFISMTWKTSEEAHRMSRCDGYSTGPTTRTTSDMRRSAYRLAILAMTVSELSTCWSWEEEAEASPGPPPSSPSILGLLASRIAAQRNPGARGQVQEAGPRFDTWSVVLVPGWNASISCFLCGSAVCTLLSLSALLGHEKKVSFCGRKTRKVHLTCTWFDSPAKCQTDK